MRCARAALGGNRKALTIEGQHIVTTDGGATSAATSLATAIAWLMLPYLINKQRGWTGDLRDRC